MVSEAIPQFIVQAHVFSRKYSIIDLIIDLFSSSTTMEIILKSQLKSMITSSFSIILGLSSIFGNEAFYYLEQETVQSNTLRKIVLLIWYFLVIIPRLYVFSYSFTCIVTVTTGITSNLYRFIPFYWFCLSICLHVIACTLIYAAEKDYYLKNVDNDNKKVLVSRKNNIYYLILYCVYSCVGIYKNYLIEFESNTEKRKFTKTNKWYYVAFYFIFYFENILLATFVVFIPIPLIHSSNSKRIFMLLFIVASLPIAVVLQISYELVKKRESKTSSSCCSCCCSFKFCKKSKEKKKLYKLIYECQIFISGKLDSNQMNRIMLKKWLNENYNLTSFCSVETEESDNESNLVRMMGTQFFISIYNEYEDATYQNLLIETARKLKKEIIFMFNSEEEKISDKREIRNNERRINFENLEQLKQIFDTKFKSIENIEIKFNENSFETIQLLNKDILTTNFKRIGDIYFLEEDNQLMFIGETSDNISSIYKLAIQTNQLNKIVDIDGYSSICVNNREKQIIMLDNNKFNVYDFEFHLLKNVRRKKMKKKIFIIAINEVNNHVYGLSWSRNKLFLFDKNINLVENISVTKAKKMKVLGSQLFLLNIEDNDYSSISVYNQNDENKLKFDKNIYLDPSLVPFEDFYLNKDNILLTGVYKNKWNMSNGRIYLFTINYSGLLIKKTKLSLISINNFILIDHHTFFFQTKSSQGNNENMTKVTFINQHINYQ